MKRLGERLIAAGLVSADAVAQGLQHQKITGIRLGDCLIELGLIQEAPLLKFLAQEFQTRFVTTEKLAAAPIDPKVLDRVPVRVAEAQTFMPLAIDFENKILTVVMAEAQNKALCGEIAMITEMNEVRAYIGGRNAIRAAIKKHYYGDPTAFAALTQPAREGLHTNRGFQSSESRVTGAAPALSVNTMTNGQTHISQSAAHNTGLRAALGPLRGMVTELDYLDTLSVLVNLLEAGRRDFRGHSVECARLTAMLARTIGLQPREVGHSTMAAFLHDVGKKADRHLTLMTLSRQPELRVDAKRHARAPIKAFEAVHLPGAVNSILAQQYEAWNGSGLPLGTKAEEIAAGARIIAVVDAWLDLTRNPANPWSRTLEKEEALSVLQEHAGILFDPEVVAALQAVESGDLVRQRVVTDGRQIFVADADEGTRTDVLDGLNKVGLVGQAVKTLDGIVDAVLAAEADTLVLALSYGVNDIVSTAQFVRARPESSNVPLLILGDPTDAATRQRLVDVGAQAFIPTPVDGDAAAEAIKKVHQEYAENGGRGRVVRGSFDELAAAELAKILGTMRKSGRVTIRSAGGEGVLHLERGRVVNAVCGETRGDAAIRMAMKWSKAEFSYDPEAILGEMPNVARDLVALAGELGTPKQA